ncbi:hypothetical protein LWI28_003561 [Acer negundo]|uniref:Uncharacterized protein n=1 Tax=Acer negundo TaxID=4023 RepID=A0AAD5JG26_ACENE|nr:hypothetical protein LWI28_003561 [Acer negundo]
MKYLMPLKLYNEWLDIKPRRINGIVRALAAFHVDSNYVKVAVTNELGTRAEDAAYKLIQQQEDSKRNPPKPSSSADSTANQNGDASDGFETVSDDENYHDHDQQVAPQKQTKTTPNRNRKGTDCS